MKLKLDENLSKRSMEQAVSTVIAAPADRSIHGKLWTVELERLREYRPEEDEDEQS